MAVLMIIVISPSKTQDFCPTKLSAYTQAEQLARCQVLVDCLRKLGVDDLCALMKISPKLGRLTYQRVQDFSLPFDLENAKQALLAFRGDVYSGIESASYSEADFTYAQVHLRILSGLYGALRPLDLIQPYRLEMGTRLQNPLGSQLYQFWGQAITEQLNRALSVTTLPLLVNLASNEYFKVVQQQYLQAPVLNISFKEYKNDQYKVVGVHAKRARGLMVNYVVKQRLDRVEALQDFNLSGYGFNASLSDDNTWVFSR